jgi:type VI secretion system protein ImpH
VAAVENELTIDDLVTRLARNGSDQSFFQAVRLVLNHARTAIGRDQSPTKDPLKFRAHASIAYPAGEMGAVIPRPSVVETSSTTLVSRKPIFEATFFGLYGPESALPQHYTQLIIDRIRNKDHALREFLDLFNHRLISLFYRAWEKHHFPIAFETASRADQPDLITDALLSLVGFGNQAVQNRLRVSENTWLHYAGIKSLRGARVDALEKMLASHFRIPAKVIPFQGEWLRIPKDQQSSLGTPNLGQVLSNQLGVDAVAGSQVWAIEHRFRIQLGPLSLKTFQSFTPTSKNLLPLAQFVRTYVGPAFDFDIQVVLVRNQVPGTSLSSVGGSRLGWDSWLGEYRLPQDASDAVFVCEGSPAQDPLAV